MDWDAFVHAVLTAILSCICQYYNSFLAEEMRGEPEPYGSISKCLGPLTSLHKIVPSMTLGYAICDIINGFTLGVDALAHGFATFTVMAAFIYLDASHIITPMLTMEVSYLLFARYNVRLYLLTIPHIFSGLHINTSYPSCRLFHTRSENSSATYIYNYFLHYSSFVGSLVNV